jgi:hypothetical protein
VNPPALARFAEARYRRELPTAGRPFVEIRSMRELKQLYFAWELLFDLQSERADA